MKIFLSHSPRDADLARAIAVGLRREGLSVWLPSEEIFPGDNWAELVSAALKECDAMVALFTPNTVEPGNVQWDTSFALGNLAYRRRVIPVVVGGDTESVASAVPWILERFRVIHLATAEEADRAVHEIAESLAVAA